MNKPILLMLVALLLAIKFIAIPWYEFQQTQHTQLVASTKRLQRAASLVMKTDDLQQASLDVASKLERIMRVLPAINSSEQYRLVFQQQLQKELDSKNISLEQFEWVGESVLINPDIFSATVSVRLRGAAADTAAFFVHAETDKPNLKISDVSVNSRKKISLTDEVTTTLILSVVYQVTSS